MNLAKPRIDIGFATNNAPAALAFWQNEIGLPFDHTQPIRRGCKQHRHDLCGSILKINQVYEPLPDNPPSGYRELLIARDGIATPQPGCFTSARTKRLQLCSKSWRQVPPRLWVECMRSTHSRVCAR